MTQAHTSFTRRYESVSIRKSFMQSTMKNQLNTLMRPHISWSSNSIITHLFLLLCIVLGVSTAAIAQNSQYERPSWRFGMAAGANFNFYQGTTQQLNGNQMAPQAFGHGDGVGLFLAPVIEFHRPGSVFGFMLQAGLDSRRGTWDQVMTPCNCPADLSTELSYITVEPSIRFAPFRSNHYIFFGPRFAFLQDKSFVYEQGINPDYPNSTVAKKVTGDFSDMEKTQVSVQIGTGLDIPLSSTSSQTQLIISPFITYHPYFGQTPRTIETWNNTTIRAGLAVKIGKGKRIQTNRVAMSPAPVVPAVVVNFTVNSPRNNKTDDIFIESFPLRNYIFFDQLSSEIPNRYVALNATQVNDFKENQIQQLNQSPSIERSQRQLSVYYNILNIVGDRMVKTPTSNITLVGHSTQSAQQANARAEAIKTYLVSVFGISSNRIRTSGVLYTGTAIQSNGTDPDRLRQEHNRVSIESNSPTLLAAYITHPSSTLISETMVPEYSHVTFNVADATKIFTSWKLELKDEDGTVKNFGPYKDASVSIPGAQILGDKSSGSYKVAMIGTTHDRGTLTRESTINVVKWEPQAVKYSSRFSIIYEFDNAIATADQEKYLREVVIPVIASGSTVRVYGFTDTIGNTEHNLRLSSARAANVRSILERNLAGTEKSSVNITSQGLGQSSSQSPFSNLRPEERYYNRTVLIEIISSN